MEIFEQFKCPSCDESVTYVSFTIFRVRRTRSRGDTAELAKWTFLFVLALWCITITDAMEAHISVSDPGGLIVFNASLGPGWTYRVEHYKNRSSNYAFLKLDSSTGVLYWRGNVRCLNLRENPIHVNIISSTWHILSRTVVNVTELPYSIFVHGCETTVKSRKPDVDVHKISVGVNIGPSQCIQPLTHLFGLTDFIPVNLRQCMIDVDKILSSPLVADDRLVFSSAVKICFNNGSFSVNFALSLMCDSAQLFHLPFRLSMHPYLNKQAHRRYRRAANNRPKFNPTAYTENVKEEQPPGVQVVTITATDTDTEGAGTLTYTMASTRDDRSQSMFAINPLTGTINTTQKLDREFIKAHYFIVIATDHGVPPESASASLTIIVDDVNDHAPRFDQDVYSINFSEGQVVGYPVLTIQATDQDFGKNAELRYSIANPEAPNDAFMIDPVTGAITTMAILDREKLSSFRLLIQAVDQGDVLSERRSSTATVIIQITDENDNSPIFSQQSYQVTVREDQNVSLTVPIIQVNATDADAGKNAEIQYQLSGNNLQKFRIDPMNGKLFLIEQLNYEETQEFSLTVRAEDQGTPSKRTSVTILVRVLDINDNPPKFILDLYEGMVTENVDLDTSILQVQAFDADSGINSQLTYSFVGEGSNSSLPFVIDSKSAWIRTSGNIDRENRSVYNLKIKAVDNGVPQLSATTSVVIIVRDLNDNAPIFQLRAYDASVSEEAKIGEEVVRVLAVDLDDSENARVIYAITDGNLGESFQMGQSLNEGVISVHKQLDARQFNRFTLTVSATDSGGRKDTVQVFINVTDTNRNAPEFQGTPYHFNVQENIAIGTSVFKVNAIDKDRGENARITYSMDPGISAFAIDPNNGVISTRAPLDRESVPAYTLKVTATDNGKPQLMDTEVIDVTIDDQNDNKPEFTEITYNGHIAEDALPGERVLRITATDRDKDSNGQVIYTFDKGNDGSGDFSIDSALGWIRVAKNLDRERIPSYELVAFAVDRGLNPQSSSVIIRIKIDDVNDNHPQFEAEEINVYITENSPIGSTVAQITATDPDEGLNALVEYSFEGGADVDSFQLSGRKGDPATITTLVNLDYESGKKKYEIILRAASDTQFSTAKIFINVRDVNDNAPILKDFLIIYNNFGGSFPIGPIGRIPASDPDVSDQELLSYQILSGNEASLLYLNSSTGQITLDSRLNSDVPRNGTFQVSVSDGKNVVRATCRLYVRLITPEMLRDSVTIRLDRMTQTAFLSSLLKFFTDALASIFHTEIANIYIINIEDDVDVPQAQILNVSVSVRQRTISVQGRTRDVFYSPEYLREYIYLYRSLLANLSALQVLPFDDNLCLQEPCANFAVCLSTVNEGIAMPFVASDTLLFRPIHPVNGYKCECPHGFAGMQLANACDVEIDLCYSIPCLNNGTCIPHESGYTCQCTSDFQGANCEVNMTTKYDAITCPQNFCQPPSVCVPLIRGGFRCDGCPDDGNYDKFCRLKTRNFRKGSYLTFPSLKKRNRFTVKLRFATQERNGLLLYNGRFNEEHDFIGLEIVNSQVVFSFSLGGNHTSVSAYTPGGVSTGDWFQVTVQYHQQEAILIVGEDCDTNIAILYGDKLDNYSCAAKVSHTLPAFCDNPTENCYRLLDLTGPLQLGGLPWAPSAGQVTQNNFIGCISEVYLDDELLDLNTSVAGEFTSVGCQQKLTNCQSSPCTLGGKCKEGWTTFTCDCPEKTGGKDCSQVIEASRQLTGNAYLFYENVAQNIVYYPWYNGLAFRTRAKSGILMQVVLNGDQVVKMQLQDGFVRYSYRENVIDVDSARVNDGQWHYVEARWYAGYVEILLDYGQRQKTMAVTASVSGSSIQRIYVGGFQGVSGPVMEGFVGCIKGVRVGNNPNAILSRPTETGEIRSGCSQANACDSNPCGPGTCQDLWGASKCLCPPGTIGPRCENICRQYNPCENWAECQQPLPGATTYTCACGSRQSGRYCENMAPLTCPAAWWGDSVCGPCNCDQRKGFESNCNKTNGMCYCKDLHFQLPGEDQCYPCDCYTEGSLGQSCDHYTGQCQCQDGVIGRRCDQCDNIFAGINLSKNTCEIMSYEECPRNYAQKIWWEPVAFGQTAVQDCPPGASGSAKRECAEKTSWLVADLFNCTSDNFTKLASQLADFEAGAISPYSADLAVELLKNATNTTKPLYGGDILMTLNFAMVILKYENNQTGLGLISQQYRDFVQQLVIALSNVTSLENVEFWPRINEMYQGAATLLYLLEQYLLKIATIMPQAQSSPFEVVSDEIVLGADWMTLNNISERSVPKYDNNVNKGSADKFASIKIPSSLFPGAAQGTQEAKSYFGYAIYHTMGKLMVMNTDNTIRRTGLPLTVNGPVFTFVVTSQGKQVSGTLSDPVYVRLKLASPSNKTNLQCATWTVNSDGRGLWSGSYCSVLDTDCLVTGVDADECLEIYITCKCFHLSTFAVLVDQEDGTAIQQAVVQLEVITYILVGVSLTLLFVVFFILISYKSIYCNWNSIHVNLVFVIFLSELAFVVGINRTTPELFCRLVAIALHYFYMSAFAWLYVEVLHIYRLLTEKHTINYGSMKFYYLLGYVIPGIIVGLAVGLYTDGYGNDSFCWLETSELLIWSFAGPIVVVVVLNIITFMFALKASCREKVNVSDISAIKLGLMGAILLLLLLSITWVLGLLTVNFDIAALGYVHAIFVFLQGTFLFIIYILLAQKVRLCLKRTWYRLQGKKFGMDDGLSGTRSSVASRSALAYRNDSSPDTGFRINVGISTTSTTSQSSKSTGRYRPPHYKDDDFGRSTSSSTSGHVPSGSTYPHNTGIAPYGYEPSAGDALPEEEYAEQSVPKIGGNDSESDSDASVGGNSLDLASSHSSDEDDEFEIGLSWEQQIPKSIKVEQAREQLEKQRKDKERERLGNNNSDVHWVDSSQVDVGVDLDPQPISRPHTSSVPPDVTLSAAAQRTGRKVTIVPPPRTDSLQNNYTGSSNAPSDTGTSSRVKVQVLTHNGSLSSDSESESSGETNV